VERTTALILSVFSAFHANAASAHEVAFTCNYELGAEPGVKQTKLGVVAIALDLDAKTARIDFGKGWGRTIALLVDGNNVKETSPPASLFYFDLTGNNGGIAGGIGLHQFFDTCVQTNSGDGVAGMPNSAVPESSTMNSGHKQQTSEMLATTTAETTPAPTFGQATTEYFGGAEFRPKSAFPTEATMNPDYDKGTLPIAASSITPPSAKAAIKSCSDALSTEARLAKLYFANSSIVVDPGSQAELRKIAKIVKNCGNVEIEVGGHTDNLGNPTSNKRLSLLRANAVVDFLIAEGVGSSSLKAHGYGQEHPIATNGTLEGRRFNRRVEVVVSDLKSQD
jgi:outer membrane protein OmpA-like peptidoglycan-associated protein